MDFVNVAAVEFVGAIEAQRAFERGQRKWLRAWRQLERAEREQAAPIALPVARAEEVPERRAA